MTNEPQGRNFKERVFASIAERDIKIHPKIYFVVRIVLLAIVACMTLLVSVFIINYVFFSLRISGRNMLLGFGSQGWIWFFAYFPWALLAVDVILVGLLEWLLKQFRFGYRSPTLYLLIVLFAVTISAGYFMNRISGIDDALLRQADLHYLGGPLGQAYESVRGSHLADEGICECAVTAVNGNVITARDINSTSSEFLTIVAPPGYVATNSIQVGSVVFVAGTLSPSGTIQAFGIGPLATSDIDFMN